MNPSPAAMRALLEMLGGEALVVSANERIACHGGGVVDLDGEPLSVIEPAGVREAIRQVLAGRSGALLEHPGREDGQLIRTRVRAVDVPQEGRMALVLCEDVTEQRDTEARLTLALDAARAGVWDWYADDRRMVTDGQPVFPRPLPEGGFPDRLLLRMVPHDDRGAIRRFAARMRSGLRDPGEVQFRVRLPDGSLQWLRAIGRVVERNPDGTARRVVGLHVDIQQQKSIEGELIEARDRAEQAAVAKGTFLASMSHEIRTPMNGVLGMLGLLADTDLDEDQRELVGLAQRAATGLLDVINDILDFSKIGAGKLVIDPVPMVIRLFLNDFHRSMGVTADARGVALEVDCGSDVPDVVVADDTRIRQILTNLVGNAIKFTPSGGRVCVSVTARETGADSVDLRFEVADTGIGIPEDKIETIFSAFEQADGGVSREYGGTGLGLAITSRLVALMDGSIAVRSEVGVGSTFTVDLRLGQAASAAA